MYETAFNFADLYNHVTTLKPTLYLYLSLNGKVSRVKKVNDLLYVSHRGKANKLNLLTKPYKIAEWLIVMSAM